MRPNKAFHATVLALRARPAREHQRWASEREICAETKRARLRAIRQWGAMAIDKSGKWWKGSCQGDIEEYLRALEPGGYPLTRVIFAQCSCNGTVFDIQIDPDDELARTICKACGKVAYVSDSEELWETKKPKKIKCPCKASECEIGLGLSIKEEGWVRWMSIGKRCTKCGVLSSPLDWKSDADLNDAQALKIGG